ncbi:MAG: conserved hypothetical protein [Methanobrevibacter sp. CfCl-M3]
MNNDFSTEKKEFNAIKFKRKLQENVWKNSGAKNLDEYVDYINKRAKKSAMGKNMRKVSNH